MVHNLYGHFIREFVQLNHKTNPDDLKLTLPALFFLCFSLFLSRPAAGSGTRPAASSGYSAPAGMAGSRTGWEQNLTIRPEVPHYFVTFIVDNLAGREKCRTRHAMVSWSSCKRRQFIISVNWITFVFFRPSRIKQTMYGGRLQGRRNHFFVSCVWQWPVFDSVPVINRWKYFSPCSVDLHIFCRIDPYSLPYLSLVRAQCNFILPVK